MRMHRAIKRSTLTALLVGALVGACDDDDDNAVTTGSQSTNNGSAGSSASAGRTASGDESNAGSNSVANAPASGSTTDTGATTTNGVANAPASGSTTDTGATTTNGVANAPASGSTTDTGGQPANAAGSNGTAITLDDAQIAAVTSTVNMGEIDTSKLALTKAQASEVRDFAQTMITMHTAALERQMAVLQKLDITPAPNPISEQVKADADALLTRLQSTDDAQFDSTYMMGQVDLHTKALTMLDDQLIPQAMAPELKADLTTTRGEVAMHLDNAKAVLDSIGGNSAGD